MLHVYSKAHEATGVVTVIATDERNGIMTASEVAAICDKVQALLHAYQEEIETVAEKIPVSVSEALLIPFHDAKVIFRATIIYLAIDDLPEFLKKLETVGIEEYKES